MFYKVGYHIGPGELPLMDEVYYKPLLCYFSLQNIF